MLVFAFDRDWTVDVNPHPRNEPVPLEWVRHLAHESPHAVYAIGNQTLAEEAAIPGVVDIVGQHPDDWDEWLGGKQADGRYERFPTRRERLSLIADLHPDAEGYVVVDDLDLGDVDGWDHYHAWEFVPAVEAGDIHPSLPWVREPMADGGLPTSAGITPVDASMLASFLEDYENAAGFELTYDDEGTERTAVLHDVSIVQRSLDRPSAAPAIRCIPISPAGSAFNVRVDDVQLLNVVEPPTDHYTAHADTPAETAAGLRRQAAANPESVRVSSVLSLLDRSDQDPDRDRDALRALRRVAAVRPADCTPAIPILDSLLGREDPPALSEILATLEAIGTDDPGAIAPLSSEIIASLDSSDPSVRRESVKCLAAIADEHPDDALDAVPLLATVVEDGVDGDRYAVYALSRITDAYPEAVKPVADTLAAAILDESLDDGARLNAAAGLGRIVGEYPSIGVDVVDDLVALFDADNRKLRNNAIGIVGDVAKVHTDVVEPHVGTIAPLLTVDDEYTRVNTSSALARVAEDFPEAVQPVASTYIELLEDDHPIVRENACWALGYLAEAEAESALRERVDADENVDVRTRASWALSRLER